MGGFANNGPAAENEFSLNNSNSLLDNSNDSISPGISPDPFKTSPEKISAKTPIFVTKKIRRKSAKGSRNSVQSSNSSNSN